MMRKILAVKKNAWIFVRESASITLNILLMDHIVLAGVIKR